MGKEETLGMYKRGKVGRSRRKISKRSEEKRSMKEGE
jgi:hypothetical protein